MTTKEKLLELLEANKGAYFSGEEIAQKLCVSRAAVWKAVNALREEGYCIDAVTNKGYCLSEHTDILSPQGIRKYLKPAYQGMELTVLPEAASTNALLREKANQGAPEGCAVIANQQTAGRGRCGRQFYSPRETGIYMSVLLRPVRYAPQQAVRLTAAAAVTMCEAIEAVSGESAQIKWVNDIFVRGKKVCGILTEASFGLESGALEYAVLGVGVNVYPPKEGFPKELEAIAGAIYDSARSDGKNRLAGEFLNRFLDCYNAPERTEYIAAYRSRSLAVGKQVTVYSGNRTRSAYAYGVDDECRLLVRYENGETESLSYGEIRIKV
ncbi:MAG: biotin--[acetyl-CoA-carboxylase] ligase [Faecousia sp.]